MSDPDLERRCASLRMDAEEIAEKSESPDQLLYAVEVIREALATVEAARQALIVNEAA